MIDFNEESPYACFRLSLVLQDKKLLSLNATELHGFEMESGEFTLDKMQEKPQLISLSAQGTHAFRCQHGLEFGGPLHAEVLKQFMAVGVGVFQRGGCEMYEGSNRLPRVVDQPLAHGQ